jgi:hypothetical protein
VIETTFKLAGVYFLFGDSAMLPWSIQYTKLVCMHVYMCVCVHMLGDGTEVKVETKRKMNMDLLGTSTCIMTHSQSFLNV